MAGRGTMTAMDEIKLTGLRVSAFHGVLENERADGQLFLLDVTVRLPLERAGLSDDLADTVHYGELAERIAEAVQSDPVDLVETVAERVARIVLENPLARSVVVTVHKPNAPISVPFDDVSVTIERARASA
jgi:dihydroneopterin aldolase